MHTDDKNILHGPTLDDYSMGTKSMGELCLKRLTENGDFVTLVSEFFVASY